MRQEKSGWKMRNFLTNRIPLCSSVPLRLCEKSSGVILAYSALALAYLRCEPREATISLWKQ